MLFVHGQYRLWDVLFRYSHRHPYGQGLCEVQLPSSWKCILKLEWIQFAQEWFLISCGVRLRARLRSVWNLRAHSFYVVKHYFGWRYNLERIRTVLEKEEGYSTCIDSVACLPLVHWYTSWYYNPTVYILCAFYTTPPATTRSLECNVFFRSTYTTHCVSTPG